MYRCDNCGEEFSGFFCPRCDSENCSRLCSGCNNSENNDGLCDDCLNHYAKDYETLEKASNECKNETISVPALIADVLSAEQIKTALFQYIENNKLDCRAFIEDDREWFADFLEKEEKGG